MKQPVIGERSWWPKQGGHDNSWHVNHVNHVTLHVTLHITCFSRVFHVFVTRLIILDCVTSALHMCYTCPHTPYTPCLGLLGQPWEAANGLRLNGVELLGCQLKATRSRRCCRCADRLDPIGRLRPTEGFQDVSCFFHVSTCFNSGWQTEGLHWAGNRPGVLVPHRHRWNRQKCTFQSHGSVTSIPRHVWSLLITFVSWNVFTAAVSIPVLHVGTPQATSTPSLGDWFTVVHSMDWFKGKSTGNHRFSH